jgi:uncharacterized heparinase superfamily protein
VRLNELGRLWRTVRHLKPIQIVGRAHFLWRRPRPDARPAAPLRAAAGPWQVPAAREPSLAEGLRFSFLGQTHELDDAGWDAPEVDRLWRYNLHYFDDLNARDAAARRSLHRLLLERWLQQNPPPTGTPWEPYPTSLRIVNWIKWWLGGEPPPPHWVHSLALQARWLRQRLEWHLLGNHLFANAKALMFAGLYFDGAEADAWLATGLRIVQQQLPEQILADGGHFERSTMYHALALEDLLDLLNLLQARGTPGNAAAALQPALRERAAAMLLWLRAMSHPDGGIAFFNDAAQGIAPDNAELEAYAARLGIAAPPLVDGLTDLPASGYARLQRGPAVALLDMAPLGPDYLLGHAHADTLAFELSLHGRRLVVNGGTSRYGLGPERLRERGTAWHSTVQLGSGDSSEVWSGFRVGRCARIVQREAAGWEAFAAHDGWRTLPGAPRHQRRWRLQADGLEVIDAVAPGVSGQPPAVARFHLAPGLTLRQQDAGRWQVLDAGWPLASVALLRGRAQAESSTHAPRFGQRLAAQCLAVTLADGGAHTHWRWPGDAHPVPH